MNRRLKPKLTAEDKGTDRRKRLSHLVCRVVICLGGAGACGAATPEYTYKVVHVYPHDRTSFTEGLEYRGGFLYESTGEEGHSVLRKTKLETGEVVQEIKLAPHLFGEGITI